MIARALGVLGAVAMLAACLDPASVGGEPLDGGAGAPPSPATTKLDLLLGIDNSISMGDKQELLALALSDLVSSLANPVCVDAMDQPIANQPTDGQTNCPPASHRSHTPVNDIHIGIVTSSLGGHGSE